MKDLIQFVECPRDAMQGWAHQIPTDQKIEYLKQLLKVGFDTLDCGSFVSAKAIPQMADTAEVLKAIKGENTKTKLLVIAANERGAEEAVTHENVSCIGFPFSISPTFQRRNTNSTIEESFERVEAIQELCIKNEKQLVVYLSMAFGNPYGDEYNEDIAIDWLRKIVELEVSTISLADTVGQSTAKQVGDLFSKVRTALPDIELGVHLHATIFDWQEKMAAALEAGCRRFDGALKGLGGCPMAKDELVGNMDTEKMIGYAEQETFKTGLDHQALRYASALASKIFV
jgi:hydroxymethylglutaryl-CoA lyase